MRISVTTDYRGELTEERFYLAGEYEVGDAMPRPHALALVDAGRATVLIADTEEPVKTVAVKRRKTGEGLL